MFVGFHHARFDSLAALWNECLPEGYRLNEDILRSHTVDCPVFDWGASVIDFDDDAKPLGFVAVKRSAHKLYGGPDPDQAHISAIVCPSPKHGVELLAFVKQNLKDRGVYHLTFGQDSRHFFPGCPTDIPSLKDLLMIEGFEDGGELYDLSLDLKGHDPVTPSTESQSVKNATVRPISDENQPALEEFLRAEFPGRWTYDVLEKTKAERRSDFVTGLFLDGQIVGFCLTQDSSHRLRIGGAVLTAGIGSNWCSIGPIGIAKSRRGEGLGDALLAGTLQALKAEGKETCVVDWTVLTKWYGKHGFQISRTYKPFHMKLEDSL